MRSSGAVGRDDDDVELVDLGELFGLGLGRAGHARELLVLAEVVLEGDGRERLVLALDLHLLLGLDRLVQAVAPAPARHQAPRELVHDHDLAVLDHVVHVQAEERVRAQRLVDVMEQRHVRRVVQAAGCSRCASIRSHAAIPLSVSVTVLCFSSTMKSPVASRLAILTLGVAARDFARLQPGNDPIDFVVQVGRLFGRPGDDERRPRFVDRGCCPLRPRSRSGDRAGRTATTRTSCCRAGSRSRTRCWCRR